MKFQEFVKASGYRPLTVAKAILNYQKSERIDTLMQSIGYKPTAEEKTKMRYLISGKGSFEELFPVEEAA